MKLDDNATPAVVLVCHHHVGLGIMRSLGSLGVETYGIEGDTFSPALASRYCRGKFPLDLHRTPADRSLEYLGQVGARIGRRALLIPTSDAAVMFVAEHAQALSQWFIFPERDPALVRRLCDKREMYHLARACGVATPETAFPTSRAEVLEFCGVARFPVLVKPILHRVTAFHPATKQWRMKLVHSHAELLAHYDTFETPASPNVMLQEYIPGGDEMTWTFNGYFDRTGECRAAFTGRKLRNFPAYFGQASLAECIENEVVRETTIKFMTEIGYKGPLDIGYRHDVRDGRYKVNDVNPRIGAMFRLFTAANGMDVVRAMYQDMTGQVVEPSSNPHGRRWIVEDVDLISALRYWRDGRLTAREWFKSLRGIDERTLLCRGDLRPLVAACLMDARRALFGEREERPRQDESSTSDPAALTAALRVPGLAYPAGEAEVVRATEVTGGQATDTQ